MQANRENVAMDFDLNTKKIQEKEIQEKIFAEQFKLLHENLLISTPAYFLCATAVYLMLKETYGTLILVWYFLVMLISLLRLSLFYSYRYQSQRTTLYLYTFILATVITAFSWGVMGSLFMPQNLIEQMVIVAIIAGITTGGIQLLDASLLASFSCVIVSVLPLAIWFLLQGNTEYLLLSAVTMTYLLSLIVIAWRGHNRLVQILRLRYENMLLNENLSFADMQLQKLRETLSEQAIRDSLTGLFNRHYLEEILPIELKRIIREKRVLSVAMFDLDYFKQFNDTNGQEGGDVVLKYIGGLLRDNFRGSDIACRFGGEEFILVLVGTSLQDALLRMQHIRNEIKKANLYFQGHALPKISISIGIAEAPTHGNTIEAIIHASDEALRKAKRTGKDRVVLFSGNRYVSV